MTIKQSSFKLAASCQNQVMAAYQRKIRLQTQFLQVIKSALPEAFAEHLGACVISRKTLLLYADTQEWATQLHYHQAVILNAISVSNLPAIDVVETRVISESKKQQVNRKVNLPSRKNIEMLRDSFQTIKDDELKSALARLSQTLDKLS